MLRKEPYAYINLMFANCFPHSLALFMKKLLGVLDEHFGLQTHMKSLRAVLNAGGSSLRRTRLIEFGLTASGIDFTDTRWTSFVKALVYLASKQTPLELQRARVRLETLVADGSLEEADMNEAMAALNAVRGWERLHSAQTSWLFTLSPAPPPLLFSFSQEDIAGHRYEVLYTFLEEMDVKELTARARRADSIDDGTNLPKLRGDLLNWLASARTICALHLITRLLGGNEECESVATIFSLAQGRAGVAATCRSSHTGEVPELLDATEKLLHSLDHLAVDDAASPVDRDNALKRRARLLEEVHKDLIYHGERVIKLYRDLGMSLFIAGAPFLESDVSKYKEENKKRWDGKLKKEIEDVLVKAISEARDCKGRKKLDKCLTSLNQSRMFDLNHKPAHVESDDELLDLLGATGHENANAIIDGWREHEKTWKEPDEKLTPQQVFEEWVRRTQAPWGYFMRKLAAHALVKWSRPISSAGAERVFSYLSQMDAPTRSCMSARSLRNQLFLRGNWQVMGELVRTADSARRNGPVAARVQQLRERSLECSLAAAKAAEKEASD